MQQVSFLTVTAVARRLGLGESGTRRIDDLLRPMRDSSGRRLYDPDRVEALARLREQRKAK